MCRIEYITLYTVIQIVLLNRSEHRVSTARVYLSMCTCTVRVCVCTCVCVCENKYVKRACASVRIRGVLSASRVLGS